MKKLMAIACMMLFGVGAFAYDGYGYYEDKAITGLEVFSLIVTIVYIILSIVILTRWWKMTEDVKQIRENIPVTEKPKLTYLVAIGEKEQAEKAALVMLVDLLYPIYMDENDYIKTQRMDEIISARLPRIERLGLRVPDYVTSGEKFIDYMNNLTGNNVA